MCGGIAAYKAVEVCRRLVDAGAIVSPVMTRGATRFVGPVTLLGAGVGAGAQFPLGRTRAHPAHPAGSECRSGRRGPGYRPPDRELRGGDLVRSPHGHPARHPGPGAALPGHAHGDVGAPRRRDNLALLRRRGVHVVEPATGRLAGGDVGSGRLADPADIVAAAIAVLSPGSPGPRPPVAPASAVPSGPESAAAGDQSLSGLHAVVTAGGTREPIDPVRFVGNRSSGKQGYAIATALARRGARVTLISTVALTAPDAVEIIEVETAAEMEAAVKAHEEGAHVIVMAAAVADFRPKAGRRAEAQEGRGRARDHPRTDPGHPGRPRRPPPAGPGARRFRRRNGGA